MLAYEMRSMAIPSQPIKSRPKFTFFDGLSEADTGAVLAAARRKKITADHVVIQAGEPARHMFLLEAGRAKYYRLSKGGDEVLLGLLCAGDVFGVGTLLGHPLPYIGTAEAVQDCALYVWERSQMRHLAQRYPQLAENSLRTLLQYMATHADHFVGLITENAEQRLEHALLHMGNRTGQIHPDGVEVEVTNEQLSALAHVSRFTVSRLLSKLGHSGAVAKKRGKILIHSPEALLVE